MMEHVTKSGEHKIVERCSYPLTGVGCVSRIYTDLAIIDVTSDGLVALEWVDGLSFDELSRLTGAPLRPGRDNSAMPAVIASSVPSTRPAFPALSASAARSGPCR